MNNHPNPSSTVTTAGAPTDAASADTAGRLAHAPFLQELKFNRDGLIPAIIQDHVSKRVLMMAWMNRAALEKTLVLGKTVFWSRSRQSFWMKGETSGNVQIVKDIAFDCDADVLLIQVEQTGPACHEGYRSCFFRSVSADGMSVRITESQMANPQDMYGKK